MPLQRAIVAGNVSCFFTLLDYGANIHLANSIDKAGRTLLIRMAQYLHKSDDIYCKPLAQSAVDTSKSLLLGTETWIEKILRFGLDINACDSQGMNALLWAVRSNKFHVADHLLRSGADYLQKNIFDSTILHLVAQYGSSEMLSILKKHNLTGLRLDAELPDGTTATDLGMARKNVSERWFSCWHELVQSIIAADLEVEQNGLESGFSEESFELGSGAMDGAEEFLIENKAQEEDGDLLFHDAEEFIAPL